MRKISLLLAACLTLLGCAGPHGERPALDATKQSTTNFGFNGAYAGTTGAFGSLGTP